MYPYQETAETEGPQKDEPVPQESRLGLGTAQQPSMLGLTTPTGYKDGGLVRKKTVSRGRRGDGICTKGHTKGRMY